MSSMAKKNKATEVKNTSRFTEFEKSVIVELVEPRKLVVESKKTDFGTIGKKNKAWEAIAKEYNSTAGCSQRLEKQLKDWWRNAKARTRTEVAKVKKSFRKTGGGSASQELSEEAERIASIVPEQMESLENPYDCDGDGENSHPENSEILSVGTPPSSPQAQETTGADTQNHSSNINALSEGISSDGEPNKKRRKSCNSTQLKDTRLAILQMEEEEHDLRLQALRLEIDVAQTKLEKVRMEKIAADKEHVVRMEVLRAKLQPTTTPAATSSYWNNEQSGNQSNTYQPFYQSL